MISKTIQPAFWFRAMKVLCTNEFKKAAKVKKQATDLYSDNQLFSLTPSTMAIFWKCGKHGLLFQKPTEPKTGM